MTSSQGVMTKQNQTQGLSDHIWIGNLPLVCFFQKGFSSQNMYFQPTLYPRVLSVFSSSLEKLPGLSLRRRQNLLGH